MAAAAALLISAPSFGQTSAPAAASFPPLYDSASPAIRTVKLPTGTQYDVIKEGSGDPATTGMRVMIHYTLLINGEVNDSSRIKHVPTPFGVVMEEGKVVPGFNEGLRDIKVGERRRITVPPDRGYGSRSGPGMPANSTLYFDVECVAIKKVEPKPKSAAPDLG